MGEPRRRKYAPNTRISKRKPEYDILSQDLAIRTYWADLTKPNKPVSNDNKCGTLIAVRKLLATLGKPISTTAMQELVDFKRNNPKDTSLEQQLKLWKAESTTVTTLNYIARILGIFRRNFAPLEMHIHVSSDAKTIPVSESILRAIRLDNELTAEEHDAIDLMAYGAERVNALNKLPLENVHLIEDSTVALLDIPASLSKTGLNHASIIPKELAERLLDKAARLGYKCLTPNSKTIWRRITKLAASKYKVRLTSHYFRKRFETIAERIPANEMNPNHWMTLMGSKPTLGHMPSVYSLIQDTELIAEYETQLMPRLALTGETKAQPNQLAQLRQENAELKEQLLRLTKLLTEKLERQQQS